MTIRSKYTGKYLVATLLLAMLSRCTEKEYQAAISPEEPKPPVIIPTPKPPVSEITDMVLIYGGSAHRNFMTWDKEHFTPYVSYKDRSGQEHWLFDGFLLIEFVLGDTPNGANSALLTENSANEGRPATKQDWNALINYMFTPAKSVAALNECVAAAEQRLGTSDTKRKVVVSIPVPIMAGTGTKYSNLPADYWGSVNSKKLNFLNQDDRVTACTWYIDEVIRRFKEGQYAHLELAGFYWTQEGTRLPVGFKTETENLIKNVADVLKKRNLSFNWIPCWNNEIRPPYYDWKNLKFDQAYLQPNYFFDVNLPYRRLIDACDVVKEYDLDLELEFDSNVFVSGANRAYQLYDYMKAFREESMLPIKKIAYYQGTDVFWQLSRKTEPEDKELMYSFCEFVWEHQSKYKKTH
jgi:hypothetical protein